MKKQIRVLLHGLIILSFILSMNVSRGSATSFDCATVTEIPPAECVALVAIYLSTNGDHWTDHGNWLSNNTPSDWAKVSVDNGHVKALYLISNNLVGVIPAQIGDLTDLTYLDMGGNQISGPIPTTLWTLIHLTDLYLWQNKFTGSIPSAMGNLTNLHSVSFWNNKFTGTIPASLGGLTQLNDLQLAENLLSGGIPSSLGNLSNLTSLALYDNALTGSIPDELANLTKLTGLYLNNNHLSGVIPSWLGNLTDLKELYLMANQFTGEIPPELGNLTKLTWIGLRGNGLSGSIPTQIGNLTNLTVIDFRYNQLSGSIPASIGNLTKLTALYLSYNQLSGAIPTQIGNLTDLTELNLDNNRLTGSVPAGLANLTNLVGPHQGSWGGDGLALDFNRLTVPVPYPDAPPTALQSFLLVKDPDWQLTQAVEAVVSTEGAEITSHDSTSTVSIPSGGVTTTTTLEFVPQSTPNVPLVDLEFANKSFQLLALDGDGTPLDTFSFTKPATITIHYTEQDIQGLFENSLLLYYWDTSSNTWKDASTTCTPNSDYQRDTLNHIISVNVCHFTNFVLLENKHKLFLPAFFH
jgi:Leucine-rich repeat (LRR) protein